jgi:hypothetical protein
LAVVGKMSSDLDKRSENVLMFESDMRGFVLFAYAKHTRKNLLPHAEHTSTSCYSMLTMRKQFVTLPRMLGRR